MRIILIRHGRPSQPRSTWITTNEFNAWVLGYEDSGLMGNAQPPQGLNETVQRCTLFVTSDLRRAVESAGQVGSDRQDRISDPLFREVGVPILPLPFLRLPAVCWLYSFRILWLFGYTAGCESYAEAKARATCCAEKLVELAQRHGAIALIGHGLTNILIGRALTARKWCLTERHGHGYWNWRSYEFADVT